MTMVGGKILYEKGEFHTKDRPEEIYRKADDIVKRIMRK